jgi:hypothetical protein
VATQLAADIRLEFDGKIWAKYKFYPEKEVIFFVGKNSRTRRCLCFSDQVI